MPIQVKLFLLEHDFNLVGYILPAVVGETAVNRETCVLPGLRPHQHLRQAAAENLPGYWLTTSRMACCRGFSWIKGAPTQANRLEWRFPRQALIKFIQPGHGFIKLGNRQIPIFSDAKFSIEFTPGSAKFIAACLFTQGNGNGLDCLADLRRPS